MGKERFPYKDVDKNEKRVDSWYYQLLTKPLFQASTWLIVNFTNLTPNQISSLGLLFMVLAAFSFLKGYLIMGAILFHVRHILDAVDGRVARLKNMGSNFGAFLDVYSGVIGVFVMIGCLSIGQYIITDDYQWLILWPMLFFAFIFHTVESSKVALVLSSKFQDAVIGKKEKSKTKEKGAWSLVEKLKAFLVKYSLAEPFNPLDSRILAFFVIPIVGSFAGYMKESLACLIIILLLKEVFWFFYYKRILDKSDSKSKEEKL